MHHQSQTLPGSRRDDLRELRALIAGLAPRCHLELSDRRALARFLHSDDETEAEARQPERHELRALLRLLFRLETCSSEDLGPAGLVELWRSHDDALVRHHRPAERRAFAPTA